ncbi:uncharacterized protein E5676_scaffold64G00410 [Cucumis melo var. makuwa]|uniref:Transposase-associated domain-containing protein n=1 Tax=Cucumis melo var. makuwa TaxID=1194695 RepID=A0A5D3E2B2_CUCMM|nr:uncharacterized protein E5676_scaffold64G00410 [Cucumis melo var. makuwa]
MDKSWMMENRMSREYDVGVESFIQFGLSHAKCSNSIRCSCLKCGNRLLKDVSIVRYHLYANGIDKSYKIWFWHGEDLNSETVTSKMENIVDEKYEQDDLFNTVNMFQSAYDGSCNTSNTFDTMFDDAKKPLYPRCKKFTKLSALVRLYKLKVRYGWSNTSFSELLSIISDLLPDNNEIPTSLYEAKKTLGALGLSYQKIDACPNDCCLYRREYANSTKCPKYGLSRWKINKNSTKKNSGVAAKQIWCFPIIPRFIRMFKNLENAKNLRWHAMDKKVDGIMRHPVDTPSWRVRCFDAYKEEYFTLPAVLLWTINDFPAYGTLLDLPGKSKDGMNSRLDLVEMNIRPELAPMVTELDALQEDIVMTLCNLEKNRPEGCIAEAQVCEEAVHFCSDFLSGLDEIGLGSLNSREEKQIDRPLSAGTYSVRIDDLHFTLGDLSRIGHSSDFFIIATHGQQVFYVSDPVDPRWSVVVRPPQKDFSYKCANDDLGDMLPHYPSVSKWNSTSGIDESGDTYTRLDCEGTWVTT